MTYIDLQQIEPYPDLRIKRNRGIGAGTQRNNLFVCQVCNKAWQTIRLKSIKRSWEYLWSGFPKIGCEPKICPDCENQ